MRRTRALLVTAAALAGLAGCGGVPSEAGIGAELVVSGAQFMPGSMPAAVPEGPAVVALNLQSNLAYAGEIDAPLGGTLGPVSTAVAVGLGGDEGYWLLPAALPSVVAPTYPTFSVTLSFSESLPAGSYDLSVQAADDQGRFGAPDAETLTVAAAPMPAGALVFTLRWDTEADLDIHVDDPLGNEIYRDDIDPPGSGGELDFDSNADCVIDGRRQEDVIWKDQPPAGQYQVRVDAFSLCAASYANWSVEARLHGVLVGSAVGESLETDTEVLHDRGAGVLALTITVP